MKCPPSTALLRPTPTSHYNFAYTYTSNKCKWFHYTCVWQNNILLFHVEKKSLLALKLNITFFSRSFTVESIVMQIINVLFKYARDLIIWKIDLDWKWRDTCSRPSIINHFPTKHATNDWPSKRACKVLTHAVSSCGIYWAYEVCGQ